MNPRLQAGVELQLEKQARRAHNSSLSGVLGRYFKQGADEKKINIPADGKVVTRQKGEKQKFDTNYAAAEKQVEEANKARKEKIRIEAEADKFNARLKGEEQAAPSSSHLGPKDIYDTDTDVSPAPLSGEHARQRSTAGRGALAGPEPKDVNSLEWTRWNQFQEFLVRERKANEQAYRAVQAAKAEKARVEQARLTEFAEKNQQLHDRPRTKPANSWEALQRRRRDSR